MTKADKLAQVLKLHTDTATVRLSLRATVLFGNSNNNSRQIYKLVGSMREGSGDVAHQYPFSWVTEGANTAKRDFYDS